MPSSEDQHHRRASDPPENSTDSESEPEMEEGDDDDDDEEEEEEEEEYEEIEEEIEVEEEVEEEVEVEEEEGEEEEAEEEEIGEDLSDTPIDEDRKDISQGMKSMGHEDQLRSVSLTSEKSIANIPSDILAVESSSNKSIFSGASGTKPKEESHVLSGDSKHPKIGETRVASEDNGLKEAAANNISGFTLPKDQDDVHYIRSPLCDSGIMKAGTSKTFGVSGKEMAAAVSIIEGCEGENDVLFSEGGVKQVGMTSGEDTKLRTSSLTVPQIRTRSFSPSAEFKDGSKRPAVICDFFAKGWCIKGSSCRFLHVKERLDVTSQHPEGDVAAAIQKSELSDEGLRDTTVGSPDSRLLPLYKETSRSISPFKDVSGGSLRESWRSEGYDHHAPPIVKGGSPVNRKSLFPEQGSFSSGSAINPLNATSFEEHRRSQFMLNDHGSPVLSRSLAASSSTSLLSTGILPSWTRSSLPLSSSNIDPLGSQKLLGRERENRTSISASLLRSSSPFSGSEADKFFLANTSGDPLHSAGIKMKNSSNDWEPSLPFRPSFFITSQSKSSPGSQYDPIRDSIDQPNLGDGFPKFSSSSQGASIPRTDWQKNGDPVFPRPIGPDYSSDKRSITGHHFQDNMMEENYGKKLFTAEAETVRHVAEQLLNRSVFSKEEKLLSPVNVKDITKSSRVNVDRGLQSDGSSQKKELKVDRGGTNNEMEVDLNADGDMAKESKAVKYFRAALIEFVKELVKPTWREGQLSKDAHKMIVKKAVDKVLSTLQPNQIPSTAEQIDHYLSLFESKMAKLVEGYVDKYGKS